MSAPSTATRQNWMAVLAQADPAALADAWAAWNESADPAHGDRRLEIDPIRGPEAGLVMVSGRTDGEGDRFHLGEATVARATVRVHDASGEALGTSYLLGTDLEHARLAAIIDGALQLPAHHDRLMAAIVEPARAAQEQRDTVRRSAAHATQVNFFTVSRDHE